MLVKWLSPNTLGGIVQDDVIDRRYVDEAKALNS